MTTTATTTIESLVEKKIKDLTGFFIKDTILVGKMDFTYEPQARFLRSIYIGIDDKDSDLFGIFTPIMDSVEVKISMHWQNFNHEKFVCIYIQYEWKHAGGGTNGRSITYKSWDSAQNWKLYS